MAKKWKRPVLSVLVRKESGEAVLAGCKISGGGGSYSGGVDMCDQIMQVEGGCEGAPGVSCALGACSDIQTS